MTTDIATATAFADFVLILLWICAVCGGLSLSYMVLAVFDSLAHGMRKSKRSRGPRPLR